MTSKTRRSRRRWSEEFKRRVVAEAAVPGMSAAAVARRYDLNANLLFNWKRRYGVSDRFLPVEVSEPGLPAPRPSAEAMACGVSGTSSIEITLANGHRIAVQGCLDGETLCRLVRSLAGS
ncbi:MAG: transposase [Alphaproteobacteria bacterium]